MPDKEDRLTEQHLQSSHLPNGREIDEGDTVYFDRRLSRTDCQLPDWDIPDAAYRPVPIVWFFSAGLAQHFGMIAAYLAGAFINVIVSLVLCLMVSVLIGKWTWSRGMKDSGSGWKIATIVLLAVQWGFAALIALA